MPISQLAAMFSLTEEELKDEWVADRLALHGRAVTDGWADVAAAYDSIVAWLTRTDLPPAIRVKTRNWFAQLDAWLADFKSRCRFEDEAGQIVLVLPDGQRIRGLRYRAVRRH